MFKKGIMPSSVIYRNDLRQYLSSRYMVNLENNDFFFWLCHAMFRILLLKPETESMPPSVKVQNLNHWGTREVPQNKWFKTKMGLIPSLRHYNLKIPHEFVLYQHICFLSYGNKLIIIAKVLANKIPSQQGKYINMKS